MKVTNGDIWVAKEPLQELVKECWPVKTAYWLAKLANKVNRHHGPIEQTRLGLIQKYGTASEDGKTIVVDKQGEQYAAFVADLNELFSIEQEFDGVEKIVLPEIEGIVLQPSVLMGLEAFVEVAD